MHRKRHYLLGLLLVSTVFGDAFAVDDSLLEEVIVTASLRRQDISQLPVSLTVLGAEQLARASTTHLQDVLPLIPNLNWATGTSRPRNFQLRGVGETEQWQGAPNSSVGFIIDDIDFSGIGMPVGSFDLGQVEVLRGPQGTSFGANALAGLIAVRGREPRAVPELAVELTAGDFATRSIAAVVGGPLGSPDLLGRVSVQVHRGDGFRRNLTLQRNDTNGFDEITARGKIAYTLGEQTTLRLAALWANLNNGYDGFSLDNSRLTRSDKPGSDAQRSVGLSAVLDHTTDAGSQFRSVTSLADSKSLYSFDGDWTAAADNDFTSAIRRQHRVITQDLRLLSEAREDCWPCWVAGVYGQRLTEANEQLDLYNSDIYRQLASDYRADNLAVYGQLDLDWANSTRVALGLRRERRAVRYQDSDGTRFVPTDQMVGGQLSLSHVWQGGILLGPIRGYASVARGYKAGGFNIGAAVPPELRGFGPEFLWSAETGVTLASLDERATLRFAVFAMRRKQQQVATSLQIDPADPLSFLYLTSNNGRGRNEGLEAEGRWQVTPQLSASGALGLLRARRADGRDQAHAPRHQASISADWRQPNGWFVHLNAQHVAQFYFSDSHDQLSRPYILVNLKLGFERDVWSVALWTKNALNARYSQRGFFFGNEPPDYPEKLYVQQSDPRQIGMTVTYRFGDNRP